MGMHSNVLAGAAIALMALGHSTGVAQAQQNNEMGNMAGMKMSMPGADAPPSAATAKLGTIDLVDGYLKAMLPGQPVGGGYVTIHNSGSADDRLVSVSSPEAGKVELHEMTMQGDVMKMRELKNGIAIPAGATVTLSPNTLHMMFTTVKSPFKEGGRVPVQLTFEKSGSVDMVFPVVSARVK